MAVNLKQAAEYQRVAAAWLKRAMATGDLEKRAAMIAKAERYLELASEALGEEAPGDESVVDGNTSRAVH